LKPLALQEDTNLYLGMRNFIKAGFGNFATPYVNAGLVLVMGVNLYSMYMQTIFPVREKLNTRIMH
jgi:hypothetical protein